MSLFNFADEAEYGKSIMQQAWVSGLKGYGLANKISGYILGILIAIFIIVGIGMIVKHVIDKRSDKKMLITGILVMVIGAAVCSILLGILTGSVFPNEIKRLAAEGVEKGWISGENGTEKAYTVGSLDKSLFDSIVPALKLIAGKTVVAPVA